MGKFWLVLPRITQTHKRIHYKPDSRCNNSTKRFEPSQNLPTPQSHRRSSFRTNFLSKRSPNLPLHPLVFQHLPTSRPIKATRLENCKSPARSKKRPRNGPGKKRTNRTCEMDHHQRPGGGTNRAERINAPGGSALRGGSEKLRTGWIAKSARDFSEEEAPRNRKSAVALFES